jgi:hypothetical protein
LNSTSTVGGQGKKTPGKTLELGGGGNISGSLGTGVNASNSSTHGKSETANEESTFNESKREFESLMRDLSTSSTDDETTRQAKELTHALSDAQKYSEQEDFHRSQAKMYQESYSTGHAFTASERTNLRDAAAEVGEKQGYTKKDAFDIIDSLQPKHQAIRNSWTEQAQRQERAYPTRHMQQPNFVNLKDEKYFKEKANLAEANMNKKLDKFDGEMQNFQRHDFKGPLESTVSDGIAGGKSAIVDGKERIKNAGETIKKEEEERAEKGAFKSMGDEFLGKNKH